MKRIARAAAVLAAASLAVVGLSTASQAGTGVSDGVAVTASATDVVLSPTSKTKVTVSVRLAAAYGGTFEADGAPTVVIDNPTTYGYEYADAVMTSSGWKATLYIEPDTYGQWYVEVYGLGWVNDEYAFYDVYDVATFKAKRKSATTVNASPEPVRKGGTVTVAGGVKYWNPDYDFGTGAWRPLSGTSVNVYFDPAGSAAPKYKFTATTRSDGTFTKKVAQWSAGTWIVKYVGTSFGSSYATDYVAIS